MQGVSVFGLVLLLLFFGRWRGGGGSISDYFSPHFDVVWLMARILFHPQIDLSMVCPSSIAPMHRFSLLLVSVPYSEDSDVPITVGGT